MVMAKFVDAKGYCLHHPAIKLQRQTPTGGWKALLSNCPLCSDTAAPIQRRPRSKNTITANRQSEFGRSNSGLSTGSSSGYDDVKRRPRSERASKNTIITANRQSDFGRSNNSGLSYDDLIQQRPRQTTTASRSRRTRSDIGIDETTTAKQSNGVNSNSRKSSSKDASISLNNKMSSLSLSLASVCDRTVDSTTVASSSCSSSESNGGGYCQPCSPRGGSSSAATPLSPMQHSINTPSSTITPGGGGGRESRRVPISPSPGGHTTPNTPSNTNYRLPTTSSPALPLPRRRSNVTTTNNNGRARSTTATATTTTKEDDRNNNNKLVVCGLRYINPTSSRRGSYTGQLHPSIPNLPHGIGTLRYADGTHDEGEWMEGTLVTKNDKVASLMVQMSGGVPQVMMSPGGSSSGSSPGMVSPGTATRSLQHATPGVGPARRSSAATTTTQSRREEERARESTRRSSATTTTTQSRRQQQQQPRRDNELLEQRTQSLHFVEQIFPRRKQQSQQWSSSSAPPGRAPSTGRGRQSRQFSGRENLDDLILRELRRARSRSADVRQRRARSKSQDGRRVDFLSSSSTPDPAKKTSVRATDSRTSFSRSDTMLTVDSEAGMDSWCQPCDHNKNGSRPDPPAIQGNNSIGNPSSQHLRDAPSSSSSSQQQQDPQEGSDLQFCAPCIPPLSPQDNAGITSSGSSSKNGRPSYGRASSKNFNRMGSQESYGSHASSSYNLDSSSHRRSSQERHNSIAGYSPRETKRVEVQFDKSSLLLPYPNDGPETDDDDDDDNSLGTNDNSKTSYTSRGTGLSSSSRSSNSRMTGPYSARECKVALPPATASTRPRGDSTTRDRQQFVEVKR